jgi:hypothetical protein
MNTVSGNETTHGVSSLNCFYLLSLVISFRDRMSHLRCFLSKPLRMYSPSKVFTRLNVVYICPARKFPVVSMTNWSTVFPWALWIVVAHARTKGNCLRVAVTGPCLTCTSCNSMGVELSSGEIFVNWALLCVPMISWSKSTQIYFGTKLSKVWWSSWWKCWSKVHNCSSGRID